MYFYDKYQGCIGSQSKTIPSGAGLESGFFGGKNGNFNQLYWNVGKFGQIPLVGNDTETQLSFGN